MLLLATSCLQGRKIDVAINELLSLKHVDGLQLCPGNLPILQADLLALLNQAALNKKIFKRHHGFSETASKQTVWRKVSNGHYLYVSTHTNNCFQDSIHPPGLSDFFDDTPAHKVILDYPKEIALETMYVSQHNYLLSTIEEIQTCMERERAIALDLSHVDINQKFGMSSEWDKLVDRLLDYKHLKEIHMSQSIKDRDVHAQLSNNAFKLEIAREWHKRNKVLVLECYMHQMNQKERQHQIDLLVER